MGSLDEVIKLVRVEGGSYDFVCGLKYNPVFQVIWIYPVIWDDEMIKYWDVYTHDCVDSQLVVWKVQVSGF